ncbi:hypothetical protein LSH36_246g00016 [Paralvinella palmiformis]|uniref:Uncharacterized protein n=1 Tax=Paralvinella palmiformis TaxID=53620 RepID=A0AAD9JMG3_9ANNE|nr:hypothetical protein LSH36_246g00016 [Paralvinella palmiformis]
MPQGGKLRSDRIKNENRIPSDTDLSLYEGTYGNFAFGNITFYANRSHNLIMTYGDLGVWDIRPKIGLHRFDAVGTGHVWNWDFSSLNFQRSHDGATGPLNQVVVFGMEPSSPPVFRRNQKMFNIPPAPRDACAAVSYGAEVKVTSKTMWIVTVVSIVRAVRYLMF